MIGCWGLGTSRRLPLLLLTLASMTLAGCASSPQPSDQREAADAYAQLGAAYLEQGNVGRARDALDRALSLDAHHGEALQALALVYQQQGESELADATFRRALNAAPSLTRTRNNYAAFLYADGRYTEACEQLELAAQDTQYANRVQLFTNLGQCYTALEQTQRARESLERALTIDPRYSRGYWMLTELEVTQGNYVEAWAPLQRYLQLAGADRPALEMAVEIANARSDATAANHYRQQLDHF